jgi:hypothetical protein
VTLTAPVLDGAMSKHVLITGAEKRAALDRAAGLSPARGADPGGLERSDGSLGGVGAMTLNWQALRAAATAALDRDMRALFDDADRARDFSVEAGGLCFSITRRPT